MKMLFDQYSRYKACADLIGALSERGSILDVGSGPECLLGEFLRGYSITYVDPLITGPQSRDGEYISGNIDAPELAGRKFDIVTCVDVLEHIPACERSEFVEKLAGFAKNGLILGFPTSDDGVAVAVDQAVSTAYEMAYGHPYSWLEEHFSYQLPSTHEVKEQLSELGWSVDVVGHGHAPWLGSLLGIVICGWELPSAHSAILELSERFNRELYPFDFAPPCYRRFVLAHKKQEFSMPPDLKITMDDSAQLAFSSIVAETQAAILRSATNDFRLQRELDAIRAERDGLLHEKKIALAERDEALALNSRLLQTRSWKITAPLRFAARVARYGMPAGERQRMVQHLRRTYHGLPIPPPAKRMLSRVYHGGVRRTIQTVRRGLVSQAKFQAPAVRPVAPDAMLPDYIIWGVIDWHFRQQRPQHLGRALAAAGRRVFYVSACLVDDARAGFEVEQLDSAGRLFQVRLFAKGAPMIYSSAPGVEEITQLRGGIGEVLDWADSQRNISIVQHPFWHGVATVLPNSRVVYDCMDHHEGFGNTDTAVLSLERALIADADLTITTSSWLDEAISPQARRHLLVRNACEYEHFAHTPAAIYRDENGRRIIGYYGAIAEWFDQDLIEKVAKRFADCCVLLVGADTVNAQARLGKLPNVKFVGEVPYGDLPFYLYGFGICILPFKVTPLTLATNPVKVYEYLSAGKAVVSVDLPEMSQFDGLVYTAKTHDAFITAIENALGESDPEAKATNRRRFAKEQTWVQRSTALMAAAESDDDDPKVSVIVVTYNNLDLTRACLSSVEVYSQYRNLEIIVVDNASSDGSRAYLEEWVRGANNRRLILNDENRGFAAANNQGLDAATGDYLVMLNNDTYVTPGWIRTLVRHLQRDSNIGLIGPVTNNIGNEAKIDIAYDDVSQVPSAAARYTRRHIGATFHMRTAAFFCVMMPRTVYERVGTLDEAFGRGFFEDDDYCRRVEQIGLRIACAEDVFVHHHLSASFGKLANPEREALFEQNKATYEAKWGAWVPHSYRGSALPAPAVFEGSNYFSGVCNVCGKPSRFFYSDVALWRESLTCEHCQTTSRYRSIGRGVLKAMDELAGIRADSLAELPRAGTGRALRIYDTQPPFYYATCAYPIPDLLRACDWIEVLVSQYRPTRPLGEKLGKGITNQNLECLTFADESLDVVITSDVMEHVRLDQRAHREIYRVLKPGGIYIFTVPHDRSWDHTLVRVQITDPGDPSQDVHLLEPEYHGDTNNDNGDGVLAYRTYGRDLEAELGKLGFEVEYTRDNIPRSGIFNAELYYCRKVGAK